MSRTAAIQDGVSVIAILGPTASGKSDLAIRLAKKFNGEIVSADSRQVYRGLDLGTGKVTKKEQRMVRHHCLDIVSPPKRWKSGVQPITMAQYRQCADSAIEDIARRGKVPFLIGGSHLYVRGVLYDYALPPVPPDLNYRKKLEKKSLIALQRQLNQVDSIMRHWSDYNNKRRVIRALEIYRHTKQPPSKWYHAVPSLPSAHDDAATTESINLSQDDTIKHGMTLRYNALILCIEIPREKLYARINKRVDIRVRKGMIREVRRLREHGVSKKWLRLLGLEYRFISDYLDGAYSTKQEMLERLKYATHDFARRQLMWYRKEKNIRYVKSYRDANKAVMLYCRRGMTKKGAGMADAT